MLFADSNIFTFRMPSVDDIQDTRKKLLLRQIPIDSFRKKVQGYRDDHHVAMFLQRFTDTNEVCWRGTPEEHNAVRRFWKDKGFKYVSGIIETRYILPEDVGDLLRRAQYFTPDNLDRIQIYYDLVTKGRTDYYVRKKHLYPIYATLKGDLVVI
jgi:hypothetical protein